MRNLTAAGRLVGLLARAFPGEAERREIVEAFERGYARRRQESRGAAAAYLARTAHDVVASGWRERRRRRARGRREGPSTGHVNGTRGGGGMGRLVWELRYAVRVLARSPGFTVAAVMVLALGIGGNAAVFSAVRTVLLEPAPWPEPERLVLPSVARVETGTPDTTLLTFSYPKLLAFREASAGTFDAMSAYAGRSVTLTAPGDAERITIEAVEAGYFEMLGAPPRVGRAFTTAESGREPPGLVVIGHELWTERFGADPGVVGSRLVLGDVDLTVIGVTPRGFAGLSGTAEAWITVPEAGGVFAWPWLLDAEQAHWLYVIARLGPGVSVGDAAVRVERAGLAVAEAYPMGEGNEWSGARMRSLEEVRRNPAAETSVLVLTGAAALLLLIAIANLSALLVARATRRRRETAVRLALGSGRAGLLRGLVVETLVLAGAGGLVGLGVAWLGVRGIAAAWPGDFVGSADGEMMAVDVGRLALDGEVLLFSVVLSLVVGLLFGVLPALAQVGVDLVPALKEGGRGRRRDERAFGVRRALVAGQAALAIVLLVGAGLLGATLLELRAVDRGFDPDRLLAFSYDVGRGAAVGDPWPFHRALLERVRGLPAVEDATVATTAPYAGWSMRTRVSAREGAPAIPEGERPDISVLMVAPGYFDALGATIVGGRDFAADELAAPPRVAVLNRTAAKTVFGDDDPVGREFTMGVTFEGQEGRYRVVGVVEDILQSSPDRDPTPAAYLPMPATTTTRVTALLRTRGEPFDVVPTVRDIVRSMAPGVAIHRVTTVRDLEADAVDDTRVLLALLGLFAGVAVLLAATGVYGVVAYAVADRRRELGLRMALGARSFEVSGMVMVDGVRTVAVGVAVGIGCALAATRVLSSFLWGVGERDPATFLAGASLLLAVAALASWLPARRATTVDPAEVLRGE